MHVSGSLLTFLEKGYTRIYRFMWIEARGLGRRIQGSDVEILTPQEGRMTWKRIWSIKWNLGSYGG